jgi:hypothetical protein
MPPLPKLPPPEDGLPLGPPRPDEILVAATGEPRPEPEDAPDSGPPPAESCPPESPPDEATLDPAALEALIRELLAGLDDLPPEETEPAPVMDHAELIAEFEAMERESEAWLHDASGGPDGGAGAGPGADAGGDWAL